MARRAGWQVNDKRVRRLWRDEGSEGALKRRKKRLTGIGVPSGRCARSARTPCGRWTSSSTSTVDGRTLKMLNVIDEFTREALRSSSIAPSTPTPSSTSSTDLVLQQWGAGLRPLRQRSRVHGPRRRATGAGSTASLTVSSIPARHGRTPGSSRSTAGYATSCSTAGSFDSPARSPGDHRGLAHRLQRQPTPHRPRRPHPIRVRPTAWTIDPPTPSRIATGPPIGSPSEALVTEDITPFERERLREALEEEVRRQLPADRRLVRVMDWDPGGGHAVENASGMRKYKVAYETEPRD